MNYAQSLNDIRSITAAAARAGVTLPDDIQAQAQHLDALEAESRTTQPLTPAHYAARLSDHLGKPAAMSKAKAQAAKESAELDAARAITLPLIERCASLLRTRMRQRADEITAAFAPAAAVSVATLNEDAAKLPPNFHPENAPSLTARDFEVWTRLRDAEATLKALHAPLRVLYDTPANDVLTADAVRALRYVSPPEFEDYRAAFAFARALAGTVHSGSSVGPLNIEGVFAPSAVAHLGGSFQWATSSQVTARADAVTLAASTSRLAGASK